MVALCSSYYTIIMAEIYLKGKCLVLNAKKEYYLAQQSGVFVKL